MKTTILRKCFNCQHYSAGVCSAPLPSSFVGIHIRFKVKADSGARCQAHRMKTVRKVAQAVAA